MDPPLGRHWRYSPSTLDALDEAGLIVWSGSGNPRKILYGRRITGKVAPGPFGVYKDPQRPTYPTQKNSLLLERIIRTTSEPGDTVLDCYSGSGTTLLQASLLGRRFVGMDNSEIEHSTMKKRFDDHGNRFNTINATPVTHEMAIQEPQPLNFEAVEHEQNSRKSGGDGQRNSGTIREITDKDPALRRASLTSLKQTLAGLGR